MSAINNGGPAFPICDLSQNNTTGETTSHQSINSGLSMRDYVAIKFAAAMLSNAQHSEYLHAHTNRNRIALAAADDYLRTRTEVLP